MYKLYCPPEYRNLSVEQKNTICNGCGAKGSILSRLIHSGEFIECCNIHDYMYAVGNTEESKQTADRVFYNNMNRVISIL